MLSFLLPSSEKRCPVTFLLDMYSAFKKKKNGIEFVRTHINLGILSTTLDVTREERICSCSGGNNGVIESDYNT